MAADGLIVLGLDVSQTQANIQAELDGILNSTKTRKIILKTAIEKAETEKDIDAVVTKINKKTVKMGVEVDAKSVNSILAAQQKIASTQAKLNSQMQEYRNIAKDIGITLNKDTWNAFNHAVSSGDFTKANEILRSAKKQIEEYNAAVKKMNSDTSVSRSVSSIVEQFSKLKDVSAETQKRVNLLKANLAQFENADNTQKKLSAYKRLQTMIESLNAELKKLGSAEKTQSGDLGIKKKIEDARSSLEIFKIKYDSIGDSAAAQKVIKAITELDAALEKVDADATGGKLKKQWDAVSIAVDNAKRAVSEYNATYGVKSENLNLLSGISSQADSLFASVSNSGMSGSGIDALKEKLRLAAEEAKALKAELDKTATTDQNYQSLIDRIAALNKQFQQTKKDAKVFEDVNAIEQFRTSIEKARQKVAEYDKTYSAIKGNPALVQNLNDLKAKLESVSTPSQFKAWNTEFEQFNTKVKEAGLHTQSLGDKLKTAFKNFASFFSASRLMYQAFYELKQMISNVKDLDAAMVNLKKVTDETDASYDRFLTNAKAKAVELGTTVKDLVDATTNFSRLGFSLSESEELGQLATIYANVGDLNSIDDATNSMISTMKGFGIEAENAVYILDRFNEVGNNFAISSGDIGEALQRSASSMAAANNTIDETIALITAANTVVQDATSVGTAFKTISMRIRGATTELEAAGLDMDGMAESTATLRKEIMALSGVDIMINDDTFKSTYQILEELANKWKELTDIQQASITELIAGKRQGNIISAIMENFDIAQNALNSSLNSAGSAMKEYETYLGGLEAKTNQFKAAFEALSTTIFNSDFLKGIVELGTQAITVLDKIIQSLGGMGNALVIVASALTLLNLKSATGLFVKLFNVITSGFGIIPKLTKVFGELRTAWVLGKEAGGGFITTLKGASSALTGTASAATIATAAITAIVAVIAIAIAAYSNWKRKQEEMRQSLIEEGDAAVENSNKIAELTAKYLDMCDAVDNGTASTEDMAKAQDDVIAALELTGRSVRELTEEYGSLKDAIIAASQSQLKTNTSSAIAGANAAKEQVESDLKTGWFIGNSKYFSSIGEEADEIMSYLESLGYEGISNTGGNGGGIISLPSVDLTGGDSAKASFEDLMADYKYLEKMMNDIRSEFGTDNDLFEQVSSLYAKYDQHLSSAIQMIDQANQVIAQELIFAAQTDEIPKTAEEYIQVREQLISDLENNADWDENGTYSAEGLINSLLSENAVFQEIAQLVAEEEILAAEFKAKRDSIAEAIIPKDYKNLTEGTAAHFHAIDSYTTKLYELKNKLDTLSTEDLDIAYELMAVPDNNIQSWDDLTQAIEDYKNGTSNLIPVSNKVQESIKAIWNSEDFADAKAELIAMAKTLDGITPDAIEELAGESEELAEIFELDGMNAEFLAHVLQTVADGKDGFALITDDALKLNDALEGMVTAFDDVTEAKARYDAALAGGEKDDNFKSYAEAFEALNAEFEAGTTNSNAFWAAAEFMFGSEQLALWGWADGLDQIYEAMQKNAGVFSDAESAGLGLLDRLYELSEAGVLVNEQGEKLIEISKNADGSYSFDMDYKNLDLLAEKMNISREAMLACWEALSMWGEVNFADMAEVMSVIEEIGLAAETTGGTAVNIAALTDQLISLGKTDKDIATILGDLQTMDGIVLLNAETSVDNLTESLINLGLAADDGVTVTVDIAELGGLLSELNFTKEQAEDVITKLHEADGISLTNAGESVDTVQDALNTLSQFDFATVQGDIGNIEGAVADADDATTDNVVSEIEDIGAAADDSVRRIDNIVSAMMRVDGTTATVTINERRRSGLLGMLGFAKGTDNAPDGTALVGEEGEELIKHGDQAYLAGTNGPEIVDLDKGDTVYTAEETKRIKHGGKFINGHIPAYSGGYDGGASGTIGKKTWKSVIETSATVKVDDVDLDSDSLEEQLEDTLKEMDEEISKIISAYEHKIFLIDKNNGDPSEIVAIYKDMQEAVHEQAEEYRKLGLSEDSEYIMNLQKQWWDYHDAIVEVITSMYEEIISGHENSISLTENLLGQAIEIANASDISRYTGDIVQHYRDMQEAVHEQAEEYRKLGLSEDSEYIMNLQKQWWDYHDAIVETITSMYDEIIAGHENSITLTENWLNQAIESANYSDISRYTNDIIGYYRDMQNTIHDEAEYYRSLGYSDTSDEVSQLSDLWWDYQDEIVNATKDAWQQVVDNANDALDNIQSMYDSLKDAAQEYAEYGSITVDTLQDIISYGVEHLAYLQDENGQLVINEENIQKVIAARTQQMAIETALNYIQQLRTALTNNDTVALLNLTTATSEAASSTWDLVYAQLQLLGLSDDQYNNALQRINVMRSLADSAVTSIGRIDTSAKEALEETSSALEDLLKYVEDMVKQEVENQISALEDQVDKYREIVDLQKKSLDLEREKDKYTKDVTEKTKSIAELQARIAMLDLDDSREAQAEKRKLQEQLAEEQADLAETQADHAYEATSDMLDDMADAYEKEKQKEIEILEDSISSAEKIYQLAIDRINNHWDTLYDDLINWNYQYGNTVQSELISAWNAASGAVQQYGSYLNAVAATQAQIAAFDASSGFTTVGTTGDYDTSGGQTMSRIKEIVAQMKANSQAHHNASTEEKARLNQENLDLGKELQKLIGRTVVRGNDGVWYLDKVGGAQLYSTYPYSTYHTGGIVGDDATPKQDEMFALLKKREAVFTEPQQEVVYRVLKADETIAGKLGISGGLYHSMNGSGYAEMQSHNAVMRDMQQAQAASGGNHMSQSIGDVTVPVHVMVTEKLDKSDIQRLSREIGNIAGEEIAGSFIRAGKGTLRGSRLRP